MTPAVDGLILTDAHEYFYCGARVPGVTEILRIVGVTDHSGPWFTERAREWGSVLDQCCSMIDTDTLDWDSVDERIRPEVEAYAEWCTRIGGTVEASQRKMYSSTYGYAGTLDVLLRLPSGRYPLVDRKRGAADHAAALQTAGYAVLVAETLGIPIGLIDRYALDGIGTGKPMVRPFSDRSDIPAFLGFAAGVNWANRTGLILTGDKHDRPRDTQSGTSRDQRRRRAVTRDGRDHDDCGSGVGE